MVCHVSHIMSEHMPCTIYHATHTIDPTQRIICHESPHRISYVMRHALQIICHMTHIIYHVPCITYHISYATYRVLCIKHHASDIAWHMCICARTCAHARLSAHARAYGFMRMCVFINACI